MRLVLIRIQSELPSEVLSIQSYINRLSKRNYDGKGSSLPIYGWK